METDRRVDDRSEVPVAARRILIAVHGREPDGWEADVSRALRSWPGAVLRVVAVADVPAPRSAAFGPGARRAYAGARGAWRRLEEADRARRVGALLAGLPGAPEVLGVEAADADPARALAAVARDWGADLIVVGIDRVGWLRRHLLGGAHERLVDRARCAVLVVPAAAREARRAAGSAPAGTPGARAAAARGGA